MRYQYKEETNPRRPSESRLLVSWPGYGWWHKLGTVERYSEPEQVEAWPAHGLHRDTSRLFERHEDALAWLRDLWEQRQVSRRVA